MLKALKIILILILSFILVAAFLRNTLCRTLISRATTKATGMKLSIEELNWDILNHSLYLGGITLFNPLGFKNNVCARVKEISITYAPVDALKGRIHLREAKADISEINFIKNEEGDFNLSALKTETTSAQLSNTDLPSLPKENKINQKLKAGKLQIDRLEVLIVKLTLMNYKAEVGQTAAIVYEGKERYVFNNITSLQDLKNAFLTKDKFKGILSVVLERSAKPFE